jgi:uncharacterized membrane protein
MKKSNGGSVKSNSLNKKNTSSSSNSKILHKKKSHVLYKIPLTRGQKASDFIARFGGSWPFLGIFAIFFFGWIAINVILLAGKPFDPYPFILLNLMLSVIAAIQAPIILMAQNRQTERDRQAAKYDYQVNRKAEREIQNMQKDLDEIKSLVRTFCKNVKK